MEEDVWVIVEGVTNADTRSISLLFNAHRLKTVLFSVDGTLALVEFTSMEGAQSAVQVGMHNVPGNGKMKCRFPVNKDEVRHFQQASSLASLIPKDQLEQHLKSELLLSLFNGVLQTLSEKVTRSTCVAISYAWPTHTAEIHLQERVLRLSEDLLKAGVSEVLMDLTKGTRSTVFESELLNWIRVSDVALLIGSPSYAERAKTAGTITFLEAQQLSLKKKANTTSVIPVLMAGDFYDSIPPGYSSVMGCLLDTPLQYVQELPTLAAKLLGLIGDPSVVSLLKSYHTETGRVLMGAKVEMNAVPTQVEQTIRYWSSRVLVYKSKFTRSQLNSLDGMIAKRAAVIDSYCQQVVQHAEDLPLVSSLEMQFLAFLNNNQEVLLLQSPTPINSSVCHGLARRALKLQKDWMPVFINLGNRRLQPDSCVETVLSSRGMEHATIEQSRRERRMLFLVEGFEGGAYQTNFYVRFLQKWHGKAVFTCQTSFLMRAHHPTYYFMPSNTDRPHPLGLCILDVLNENSENPVEHEPVRGVHLPQSVLSQALLTANMRLARRVRERWQNLIRGVIRQYSLRRITQQNHEKFRQGYKLLQHDVVRPAFLQLLALMNNITETTFATDPQLARRKAFISYSWPASKSKCTALQKRLVQMVQDLSVTGIDVTLDIMQLRVGMDIHDFMKDGIALSDAILWIGTPRLRERIRFSASGEPQNPATVEFKHILQKVLTSPKALLPLWFSGSSEVGAFPDGISFSAIDFRQEQSYYKLLPIVAAKILDIADFPQYLTAYSDYCAKTDELERDFSEAAIQQSLTLEAAEREKQGTQTEEFIQSLMSKLPEQYQSHQAQASAAHQEVLQTRISQLQAQALAPGTKQAQELALYIPLKGGTQAFAPPQLYFDVAEKVHKFLHIDNSARLFLIQGVAGAGKSLFARYLEHELWTRTNDTIPLFVPLSQLANPFQNLADVLFRAYEFTSEDIAMLRTSHKRIVFILDGLDELSLDKMPEEGIVMCNRLLEWPTARVILTCRTHFLPALERHFGTTYYQHLTQGVCSLEELHLMPFDDSQVEAFLQEYAKRPDAEWPEWNQYSFYINDIPGLKELARVPFILQMLTVALPQLSATRKGTSFHRADVYTAFSKHLFEREMWKCITQKEVLLTVNHLARLHDLAVRISQDMFSSGTSQAIIEDPSDLDLLPGLPLQKHLDGSFSFLHKSILEFFIAQSWLTALNTEDLTTAQRILGARAASHEVGILEFVCQLFYPQTHHKLLLDVVLSSRRSDDMLSSTAAANAITLLNSSRFCFSQLDLSRISIPNANLNNILAGGANFSRSNLSGVSLFQGWLQNSNFQGCEMEGVQFGQHPWIDVGKPVTCVAAFDGKVVVGTATSIQAWDLSTGTLVKELAKREAWNQMTSVAVYSGKGVPDSSKRIFGACENGNVFIWDAQWNLVGELNGRLSAMTRIVVADGNAVFGGRDRSLVVWDAAKNREAVTLIGHQQPVRSVAIFGGKIASAGEREVIVWDLVKRTKEWEFSSRYTIDSILVWEEKLVTVGDTVVVWELIDGQYVAKPIGKHTAEITHAVTYEGKIIFGSSDKSVRMWNVSTGHQAGEPLQGHTDKVTSVAVDKKYIISGSRDGTVRVWNYKAPQVREPLKGHTQPVVSLVVVNGVIISGGRDWDVRKWDLETGQQLGDTLTQSGKYVTASSKLVVTADVNNLTTWDFEGGQRLQRYNNQFLFLNGMAIFEDKVVLAGYVLALLNLATRRQRVLSDETVNCVVVYKKVVLAGCPSGLRVWDLEHGNLIMHWSCINIKSMVVIDGKVIAGGGRELDTLLMWDLETRAQVGTLKVRHNEARCVTAIPGKLISGGSKWLRVWDSETNMECASAMLDGEVTAMASAPPNWIIVATGRRVQRWKYRDNTKSLDLMGSCSDDLPLWLHGCNFNDVKGVTPEQLRLFAKFDVQKN